MLTESESSTEYPGAGTSVNLAQLENQLSGRLPPSRLVRHPPGPGLSISRDASQRRGGGICELKHPSGARSMYPALPSELLERSEKDNTVSQRNTYLSQAILASTLEHARAKYRRRHDIMNGHLILPRRPPRQMLR